MGSTLFLLPFLFMYLALPFFELNAYWQKAIEILIIFNLGWLCIAILRTFEEVIKHKFQVNGNHKAKERKVLTQLRFMKSIAMVIIITLTVATILWNIPKARQLGETILTSAGVLGIIIGVAAQKSIANLITGFQVAFTQTLKIDDEVMVEGEFGVVEDITLTYVVIKTWDWRRLVLPLNFFNDKPFVNWSFNSRDIVNSVFFYVDYTFPVNDLRNKFLELIKENPLWDKNSAELMVTNTDAQTIEIRATFSSKNAATGWKLRCSIREDLVSYMQKNHPTALPKYRTMDMKEKMA